VAGRPRAQDTGVERDGRGIDMTSEVRPPLSSLTDLPRVEAPDDRGKHYRALAGARGDDQALTGRSPASLRI
jgi:hypothetical protein